jgi:hypothetical protein
VLLHTFVINTVVKASTTLTTHGFLFVLAVNRIACAGRAAVSSRAPRRVAMPTTWERTHHANPDARQHPHHTPTLRSLEPYYYYEYSIVFHIIEYSILSSIPYYRVFHIIEYSILSSIPYYRVFHIIEYSILSSIPYYRVFHIIEYSILSSIPYYRVFHIIEYSMHYRILHIIIIRSSVFHIIEFHMSIPYYRVFHIIEYSMHINITYNNNKIICENEGQMKQHIISYYYVNMHVWFIICL